MFNLVFASLFLAIPAGLLMLRRGVKQLPAWHKRPVALFGVALVSGSLTVMVWVFGAFSGALDVREACELTHHTTYDQAWRDRTGADGASYFPLVNACNEDVSLVPAWVNPTIVGLAVIAIIAIALGFFRVAAAIFHRKELVSS